MSNLKVALIAGEPSGDLLGARLMDAIRAVEPRAAFVGIGGPEMAARGLSSWVPFDDLSVMGLAEVLPRAALLLRHIRTAAGATLREAPDVFVTIDSPGFSFRLARRLQVTPFKKIHFVAPSVWAWRPGRARKIAPLYDHLLTLLPFEPPYFDKVGLPATFVGHPALDRHENGDGLAFRTRHGVRPDATLLAVLPGSRASETTRLLPIFGAALRMLTSSGRRLRVVVPTVPGVESAVRAAATTWPGEPIVIADHRAKADAFAAANAALAASGTVSLELALAGVPMVVAYDLNPISAFLAKRLVKTRFVTLVNIIVDDDVVPELLLDQCRPDRISSAIDQILTDNGIREPQMNAFRQAVTALQSPETSPSEAAAAIVLRLAGEKHEMPSSAPSS